MRSQPHFLLFFCFDPLACFGFVLIAVKLSSQLICCGSIMALCFNHGLLILIYDHHHHCCFITIGVGVPFHTVVGLFINPIMGL